MLGKYHGKKKNILDLNLTHSVKTKYVPASPASNHLHSELSGRRREVELKTVAPVVIRFEAPVLTFCCDLYQGRPTRVKYNL